MDAATAPAFSARWSEAVEAHGDRLFLLWGGSDGESASAWTYAEFDAVVLQVAGRLQSLGVEAGRAVHLALGNCPAFIALWLATLRLGGWIVPSDPRASARELAEHIRRTSPAVGVCAEDRATAYRAAADGQCQIIEIRETDTGMAPLRNSSVSPRLPPLPGALERAAVLFTSGTTAAPKGVVVTQANYAFAGDAMAAAASIRNGDRQIVVLPLFHANAQYYSFAAAISSGTSVALMPSFSASRFINQAAQYQVTHASLFAAPLRMILARSRPVSPLRLRHVWYAQNITGSQYERLTNLLGCAPRQLYGMTETIAAVLAERPLAPVHDSMGFPVLGCETTLTDNNGGAVPQGTVGEIVVRGEPGLRLFGGYLDDAETTAMAYRDGWFRTGDLAYRTPEGRFMFAGRSGDVLKVAGENVSIIEIESVLAEHPSVLEAAVIGRRDDVRDEVPVAYVVQDPDGPPIDVAELMLHCEEHLAPRKRPRDITTVEDLPRTSVGKVKRFLLPHL